MREFRPVVSIERVVMLCIDRGITQAVHIESFFKTKFKENEIDIKPDVKQISGALQRLKRAKKIEIRHGMWRPVDS